MMQITSAGENYVYHLKIPILSTQKPSTPPIDEQGLTEKPLSARSNRNVLQPKIKKTKSARALYKKRVVSTIKSHKKTVKKTTLPSIKETTYIFVEKPIAPYLLKRSTTPMKIAQCHFYSFVKGSKKIRPTDLVFIARIFNQYPTLLCGKKKTKLSKLHRAIDQCTASLASQFAPFASHQHFSAFLEGRICFEISKTSTSKTLFRETSFATQLITQYLKFAGREFLRSSLQQVVITEESRLVRDINIKPIRRIGSHNEVPTKRQLQKIKKNQEHCVNTAALILKALSENLQVESPSNRKIKAFYSALHGCIKNKFGTDVAKEITLSTFFLKFISPSLIAPNEYGIVSRWTPLTPAPLKFPTKILQFLGNLCLQSSIEVPKEISFATELVQLSEIHEQVFLIYQSSIDWTQTHKSVLHHNNTCIKWPKDRKKSRPKEQGSLQSREGSNSLKKG